MNNTIRITSMTFALCLVNASLHAADHEHQHRHDLKFSIQSVSDGDWSNPNTWQPARIPKDDDRVLIIRGSVVRYDVNSKAAIRLLQVVGTLSFARDRNTELNVGILAIAHSSECSEDGFACEFEGGSDGPQHAAADQWPSLLIGTRDEPIPAQYTARIRLHHFEGMNANDAPAIACCSGRMEIHGAPLTRSWVKLDADVKAGEQQVKTSGKTAAMHWRVGDELLITATHRASGSGTFRPGARRSKQAEAETRTITAIDGATLILDKPLIYDHAGSGDYRGEVANLSRNVIIESADPDGVRGHTVYHRFSRGSIRHARFAHLGKEGVLGRYAIHYHLAGNTMRGSTVEGVAIVDSHNRWITIHGTNYLVVRDCVGYQSVGHGFFMEDGTEVYNLLDQNLAVQAFTGKSLPKQALPFDPNDGAGFWWANGRNTLTNNVTSENDEYGYRYDMQKRSNFDPTLPILQVDGSTKPVDVRTIPIWRFENNEAHAEGFYGMVVAANGNSQPDNAIRDEKMLQRIKNVDWTGPDTKHPHIIRNLSIWGSHYAFRPHSPAMRMENVRIRDAAYGIYRPAFENHEYTNLSIENVGSEPFNRGMDDASAQTGSISVDGLTFTSAYGNSTTPLVQISDVNISGDAETHFRNVVAHRPDEFQDRWPLINRGVGPRVAPITKGVPIYLHDFFGKGRHAKVVSTAAMDLMQDGNQYRSEPTITGNEAKLAEVKDVSWPKLLDPVDYMPPATIITSATEQDGKLHVRGVTHDNGLVEAINVNGQPATILSNLAGVADWSVQIVKPASGEIVAKATDDAGNVERTGHSAKQ